LPSASASQEIEEPVFPWNLRRASALCHELDGSNDAAKAAMRRKNKARAVRRG
jgi:hypothetical protein